MFLQIFPNGSRGQSRKPLRRERATLVEGFLNRLVSVAMFSYGNDKSVDTVVASKTSNGSYPGSR